MEQELSADAVELIDAVELMEANSPKSGAESNQTFADLKASNTEAFGSPTTPVLSTPPVSKQIAFGSDNNDEISSTPVPLALKKAFDADSSVPDYNEFIRDVLLWTNKIRSLIYLTGGLLLIYAVSLLSQSKTPFLASVCYTVLISLAFNFLRNLLTQNTKRRVMWAGSPMTRFFISSFSKFVTAVAEVHDELAAAVDSFRSLKIVAILWSVSIGARMLGPLVLITVIFLAAFFLPSLYLFRKGAIDASAHRAYSRIQELLIKLEIKPRLAVFAVMLVLIFIFSRVDGAIALLALVLYGASLLQPSQVEGIQKHVEPLLATAQKSIMKMSTMAGDVAVKYELTPTPKKRKPE